MNGKLANWLLTSEGLSLTITTPRDKKGITVSVDPYEAYRLAQEILEMWKPSQDGSHSPEHDPNHDFVVARHDRLYIDENLPLPYGTRVIITQGVYRGLRATTGNKTGDSYLLTIETERDEPRQVQWISESDFEPDRRYR